MINNKNGALLDLPVNLLVMFICITFFVALLPGMIDMIDMSQQSDSLNCAGYNYEGLGPTHPLSYNATIGEKSSIGCMAMKLYVPYIALGVLIGVVMLVLYGKAQSPQEPMY